MPFERNYIKKLAVSSRARESKPAVSVLAVTPKFVGSKKWW